MLNLVAKLALIHEHFGLCKLTFAYLGDVQKV